MACIGITSGYVLQPASRILCGCLPHGVECVRIWAGQSINQRKASFRCEIASCDDMRLTLSTRAKDTVANKLDVATPERWLHFF